MHVLQSPSNVASMMDDAEDQNSIAFHHVKDSMRPVRQGTDRTSELRTLLACLRLLSQELEQAPEPSQMRCRGDRPELPHALVPDLFEVRTSFRADAQASHPIGGCRR